MVLLKSSLGYMNSVMQNLAEIDLNQAAELYRDLKSAGVIVPHGEGRSKGAVSIICSELAKMDRGKVVVDRSDVGFPDRSFDQAAPKLKQRFGRVSLLILSGSGRSLMPLVDAQKLALAISRSEKMGDYTIDVVTSDPDSPLGKLGQKYGSCTRVKGRTVSEENSSTSEFKQYGILEDVFILGASVLLQAVAECIYEDSDPLNISEKINQLMVETNEVVENVIRSDFIHWIVELLERRNTCFLAGLGSSQEVARMTGVRLGHVKRAIGDHVYVAGDTNVPPPRAGDVLIAISHSGETEVVASWCRTFKKMGGYVVSVVGAKDSTIGSLSDQTLYIPSRYSPGRPNDFYLKAAFATSPLPLYLVDRLQERGLKLPEYILRWYHSIMA
ncbi:3-hexulose-6-phosphate isomerase [Candidatus Calditenuaceae archaeon HR02]|nr:3-hexulose-6-phosphate isomerase [Candidatus Calditenuaceae archaeon HR02]